MDIVEAFFRLIVGKGKVAYRKDVIRHLEELQAYYNRIGKPHVADNMEKEIQNQYTLLARLEEKQMK